MKQEQQHLSFVYEKLVHAKEGHEHYLAQQQQQGHQDLKQMGTEIRLNFDNFADSLDTYATIEAKNREIDQRNYAIDTSEKELAKINRLLTAPYFGKIATTFAGEEQVEDFYIGINGFADEQENNLIYDWRSPVAELFYNNQLGKASYQVNQETIWTTIHYRRQLMTKKDQLLLAFDTAVSLDDEVLLTLLQENKSEKMQHITASIQQEQNQIIRDQTQDILLVNGVAGSGKTSVVMQRIAYLLYRNRQTMTPDNVCILSPNTHFIDYISEVLPSLGENNPHNLTFYQLLSLLSSDAMEDEQSALQKRLDTTVPKQTQHLRSKEFVSMIKQVSLDPHQTLQPQFVPISYKKRTFIQPELIAHFYQQTPATLSYKERLQATKQQLLNYWQQFLAKQAQKNSLQDQLLNLSESEQIAFLGRKIPEETTQLAPYALRVLQKKYQAVQQSILAMHWVNLTAFIKPLYQQATQQSYQKAATVDDQVIKLLVRHLFMEDLAINTITTLLIDEVQDYTPAQLFLINELFPKAQLTLVGDENQTIFNTSCSFDEIATIFSQNKRSTKQYHLNKSYRSSGAITAVFNQLRTSVQPVEAIQPLGQAVDFFTYETSEQFINYAQTLGQVAPLTILTKSLREAEQLKQALHQPQITIYPIQLAKGLEFEQVLLYHVSEKNYAETDRALLYTATSRAIKKLVISYQDQLSPLLTR